MIPHAPYANSNATSRPTPPEAINANAFAWYASDVSVYGASFVRAGSDREKSFRETARLLRESNPRVLAASPTNFAVEHTVRASEVSDWIGIENSISDRELETLSRILRTTALTVYAVDEKVLQFSHGVACKSEGDRARRGYRDRSKAAEGAIENEMRDLNDKVRDFSPDDPAWAPVARNLAASARAMYDYFKGQ